MFTVKILKFKSEHCGNTEKTQSFYAPEDDITKKSVGKDNKIKDWVENNGFAINILPQRNFALLLSCYCSNRIEIENLVATDIFNRSYLHNFQRL